MSRAGRRELVGSRKKPSRDVTASVLIVTEGTKTERNYLNALCKRLDLERHLVKIEPMGQDPLSLSERALALMRDSPMGAYDEVWVVFDLEGPAHPFRQKAIAAKKLKGANDLQFVESDPCIEVWLILHFDCSTEPLVDGTAAKRALARPNRWPGYDESADMARLVDSGQVCAALRNAGQLRRHNQDTCNSNPATGFDLLVKALEARAEPAQRLAC